MTRTIGCIGLILGLTLMPFCLGINSEAQAQAAGRSVSSVQGYDLEMRTDNYAMAVGHWMTASFRAELENTGTVADSVDLDVLKDLPSSWRVVICVKGACYLNHAEIYLEPGEIESVGVDVVVKDEVGAGVTTFTATMRHDPSKTQSHRYGTFNSVPSILILDDDGGGIMESYLDTALNDAGYPAVTWDADSLGRPDEVYLGSYWAVCWTTADGDASYLTGSDEQNLMSYLDGGGNLFLASMGFLSSRPGATTFTTDYLHIDSWADDSGGPTEFGVPGDPISDGMTLPLAGGPFPPDSSDSIILATGADSVFYAVTGIQGLKVDEAGHKVVFLSFPLECVGTGDGDPNNQKTLVSRVVDWFEPARAGTGEPGLIPVGGFVLRQNSPNPFRAATTIGFTVPDPGWDVRLAIYNVSGQVVRMLIDRPFAASTNTVVWDGRDDAGRLVPSGVYFYRLAAGNTSLQQKMLLLK